MENGQPLMNILIGAGVGVISAFVGAVVQFRLSGRRGGEPSARLPGCVLLIIGALGFAGLAMFAASILLTGSLQVALLAGVGVLIGFFLSYVLIVATWLARARRK